MDAEHCLPTEATLADQFKAVRDVHDVDSGNQVAHIVQSWSPEESHHFEPEAFNAMGLELARATFPGYQAVVVTHTDRAHIHNHIVVNTVNLESGERIKNKFHHLHDLRANNDRICLARGLSIPDKDARLRESRTPDKVQRMVRFGRSSYLMDMKQKADFARVYATSYDEYVGLLAEFGVTARVEDKNISYFYPGQSRGKRGKTMGARYDKPGLERTFKENDERFQREPGIRALVRGKIDHLKAVPGAAMRLANDLALQTGGAVQIPVEKDYSRFTKAPRREGREVRLAERALSNCMVPIDEIARARQSNILDYCKRSGIGTFSDVNGDVRVKGRDFVILRDHEWLNTKNHTKGSLIDLVAAHKGVTYLQAVAEINGNQRLLLLEQHFGEVPRTYTSFYVPKDQREHGPAAVQKLERLLGSHGANPRLAETLLKNHPVQVTKGGTIRFFGKDDEQGALEFHEDEHGKWQHRTHGQTRSAFFTASGGGRHATVYTDPLSFLRHADQATLAGRKGAGPVLVLLSPDAGPVDRFLASNRHVETLHLFSILPKDAPATEVDLFSLLKGRYHEHKISIDRAEPEHGIHRAGPELSLF